MLWKCDQSALHTPLPPATDQPSWTVREGREQFHQSNGQNSLSHSTGSCKERPFTLVFSGITQFILTSKIHHQCKLMVLYSNWNGNLEKGCHPKRVVFLLQTKFYFYAHESMHIFGTLSCHSVLEICSILSNYSLVYPNIN